MLDGTEPFFPLPFRIVSTPSQRWVMMCVCVCGVLVSATRFIHQVLQLQQVHTQIVEHLWRWTIMAIFHVPQRSTRRSRCPFSGMCSFRGPRQLARTGGSKMLPMLACRRERHQSRLQILQVCEERPRVVIACCRSPHVLEQLAHVLCHHRCCCEIPGWARATERVVCECAVLVHDSRQPQQKARKWLAPPVITQTLTAVAGRSTSTCNLYACVVRCISYTHKHTAHTCCTPTKGTHHRFTKCQQAAATAFWTFAVFSITSWVFVLRTMHCRPMAQVCLVPVELWDDCANHVLCPFLL
mmetsp:Transcript_23424/g.37745  ORF Transcript_23424/g.37745 Transcript_23424/m.37745 type:complete len:298 (+) Transcript_23424:151-1044(+)